MVLSYNWPLFNSISRLNEAAQLVGFKWDPKLQKMCSIPNRNYLTRLTWICNLHTSLVLLIIAQSITFFGIVGDVKAKDQQEHETFLVLQAETIAFLGYHIMGTSFLQIYLWHIDDMPEFINGLVQFISMHRDEDPHLPPFGKDSLDKLNAFYGRYTYTKNNLLGVILVLGMLLGYPCSPALAGFWMLPGCSTWSGVFNQGYGAKIVKVGVFLTNAWLASSTFFICSHAVGAIVCLCFISFRGFIVRFYKDFTCGHGSSVYKTAEMYRGLQILSKMGNDIHQNSNAAQISTCILIEATSITTLAQISWATVENLIQIGAFLPILTSTIVCHLVAYRGCAAVYADSKVCLKNIKRWDAFGGKGVRRKWTRMFVRSCQHIKIKFGEMNFFEELTPLNFSDFALSLTVNFLLLGK